MNPSATLRPLGMGELFDRAFRLYRRHFVKFVTVIALMLIPLAGLNLIVALFTYEGAVEALPSPEEITPDWNPFETLGTDYYFSVGVNALVVLVQLVLVNGVASAALTRMVADSYLGQEVDTLGAYRAIGDRWGALVRALLLFVGAAILVLLWTIIPCAGWFTGPGMLLVLAGMVLPLVAPVVVMENFGARQSLRRAWELVRGRFWWVFGFTLLLYLLNWVVLSGPSLLANMALNTLIPARLAENPQALYTAQLTVQSLVNLFFSLLYLPLQMACLTLLYFDLRVRQEGLDLMLAAGEERGADVSVRELIAHSAKLPATSPVSGREIIRFFFVSMLFVVLYFALVLGVAGVFLAAGGL